MIQVPAKPQDGRQGLIHKICPACYKKSVLQREPVPAPFPHCSPNYEHCCFCGGSTMHHIYVCKPDMNGLSSVCTCGEHTVHVVLGNGDGYFRGGRFWGRYDEDGPVTVKAGDGMAHVVPAP